MGADMLEEESSYIESISSNWQVLPYLSAQVVALENSS